MVLAVKIKNKETGEFYCKGGGFGKTGKAWTTIGYAKNAICPMDFRYRHETFIQDHLKELQSYFIVIHDDGKIEEIPVATYFYDYMKRTARSERAISVLNQIIEYCKENNIDLEEDK